MCEASDQGGEVEAAADAVLRWWACQPVRALGRLSRRASQLRNRADHLQLGRAVYRFAFSFLVANCFECFMERDRAFRGVSIKG